ncbi:hypothetical protein EP073_06225 [Geovibrio thiophilus]|uniref:Uncharacterized protein n=1 Tax=Geovibrio thiophilus TaxID=139438 RepID=A0A3R5UYN2_9BACT|nr:hypothetical protein [Geovibrio thiophilus]QAR33017.1 hypothetical protein EP073_06225 [Geovibrio thiophilus]
MTNPKGTRINRSGNLSEEDVNKILIVKNGLEDLNLIIQEIEHTYRILDDEALSDDEKALNKRRLKALEKLMADINAKVNTAIDREIDKSKFS